jgi:hypothetical protein
VNFYLADFEMIGAANEIYAQSFKHRPAKMGIGVDKLWGGALIEIEVVASRSRLGQSPAHQSKVFGSALRHVLPGRVDDMNERFFEDIHPLRLQEWLCGAVV